MEATTVRDAVSSTRTTLANLPSLVKLTYSGGPSLIGMFATTAFDARSTTEIAFVPVLVTQASLPSGITAPDWGPLATGNAPLTVGWAMLTGGGGGGATVGAGAGGGGTALGGGGGAAVFTVAGVDVGHAR